MPDVFIDVPTGDWPDQEQVQQIIDAWLGRNTDGPALRVNTTQQGVFAVIIRNRAVLGAALSVLSSAGPAILQVSDSGVTLTTLGVTGSMEVAGDLQVDGNLGVAGDVGILGDTAVGGGLDVTGVTHLDDNLGVIGQTNLAGAVTIQSTLDVNQNAVLHGALTNVIGLLQVLSNATILGDVTIGGNLSVSGNITAAGTVHGSNI